MTNTSKGEIFPLKEGDQIQGTIIKIFAATRNEDTVEGRGSTVDHTYHLTKKDALIGAGGIGVMGNDGEVRSLLAIRTKGGEYYACPKEILIAENGKVAAKLRASALGKLSQAERAALLERK